MDAFTFPHNTPGDTNFENLGVVDKVGGSLADVVALHNHFAGVDLGMRPAYLKTRPNFLI
jgi:hypothetical protein